MVSQSRAIFVGTSINMRLKVVSTLVLLSCFLVSVKAQLIFKEYSTWSQEVESDRLGIYWGKSYGINRRLHAESKSGINFIIVEQETYGRWTEEARYTIIEEIRSAPPVDSEKDILFLELRHASSGKLYTARYFPEQYFMIVNASGTGFYYWLQPPIPMPSFQKVTTNYLLPDGKTFYAFNTGVNLTSWIYNSDKVESFKYIYPTDYEIIDSGSRSRIAFGQLTDYSAILLEKKTQTKGDTIVIEIANVLSEEKTPKKALKHTILYPEEFVPVRYEAAAKGKWQKSENLLLFEAENATDGSAKIYFLKTPKPADEVKKDTVFIVKEIKTADTQPKDERQIITKGTLKLKSKTVEVTVWDAATADGDIISLNLNGKWVVENLKLNNCKNEFVFELNPGENTLIMKAENLGSSPPNTAKFQFKCGENKQVIQLRSDMGYSEQLKLLVE